MKISTLLQASLLCAALATSSAYAAVTASFDDLAFPPARNGVTGLQYTNASNSLIYQGVLWDAQFSVVGDEYRVSQSGPLFGLAHSGHYFVTNHGGQNGMMISTDKVLTSAWFGRNQYYGYSEGGADQITIHALHGSNVLASVVFDLPESHPGQPEPLSLVDTSSFASLHGITGYRIDRRDMGVYSGHWVADDFRFQEVSSVPEPSTWAMMGLGLFGLAAFARKRKAL